MPDDPPSPPLPADDNYAKRSGKNKLGKSDMTSEDENGRSRTQIIVAVVGAGGAVLAALVAGIFLIVSKSPTKTNSRPSTSPVPSTPSCSGFAAEVSVPSSVGSDATLTFHFNCPPAEGHQYMYVVEAEKFGKDKNVAYYPKDFTSATQADATINYDLPLQNDLIGQENCIYVISPTFSQRQALESSLTPQNYTLNLPGNIAKVSTKACETKTSS